jgi:hypothetical protein
MCVHCIIDREAKKLQIHYIINGFIFNDKQLILKCDLLLFVSCFIYLISKELCIVFVIIGKNVNQRTFE